MTHSLTRTRVWNRRALALAALVALLLTALPLPATAQDAPIDDLDDAADAVVRIESVGSFADFAYGDAQNVPGFGSGFIIDPSGIAVTNNHVVTGGALFRVYVPGKDRSVNAKVLGVAECADLAVIDLDGEGYPYLAWSDARLRRGMDVYAAGYPLGEPEYRQTSGEVVDTATDGDSNWASIEEVIEHDARIRPGNSGGPLLDDDGAVLGVNYAYDDARESYAVPASIAGPLVERLWDEEDIHSLGINGSAVDTGDRTGIWVASVATGSPAFNVGIKPGDLMLTLEGVALGADGTMRDYCDILASHDAGDPLAVEVYREATDACLAGTINGTELEPDECADTGKTAGFWNAVHSSGAVTFDVPDDWLQIRERTWDWDGTVVGNQFIVASDVAGFLERMEVPGVALSWSTTLQNDYTAREIVQAVDFTQECRDVDYEDLGDDEMDAYSAYFSGCPGGTTAIVTAFAPADEDYLMKVELRAGRAISYDIGDHLFETLLFDPTLVTTDVALSSVVDDSRRIFLSVPADWDDTESDEIRFDGDPAGVEFTAAPDVDDFMDYWGEPGVRVMIFDNASWMEPDVWLDDDDRWGDDCEYDGRYPFESDRFEGAYDVWLDCGGEGTVDLTYLLLPTNGSGFAASVDVSTVTGDEYEAVDAMMASLAVFDLFAADPSPSMPFVTVRTENLNVRNGPGMRYDVFAQVQNGMRFEVTGQSGDCAWYRIEDADGDEGWVSGDGALTRLTGQCAELRAVNP